MKRFFLIATLCLAFVPVVFAQNDTPATREDVLNYLQAIHAKEMNRQVMAAMSKPLHQMIHNLYVEDSGGLPPDFESRMQDFIDNSLRQISLDNIQEQMIPVYQKHFSREDLAALTQFYTSATGQKVLKEMPSVVADAMKVTTPIMQQQIEKLKQDVQEQVAQLRKPHKSPKTVIEN
jgi:hypothetical protein